MLRLSSSIAQVGQSLSVLQEVLFAFEIPAGLQLGLENLLTCLVPKRSVSRVLLLNLHLLALVLSFHHA